ncbi:MAG: hypothetical protein ACRCX2_31960 [Paraclostridium sp.]
MLLNGNLVTVLINMEFKGTKGDWFITESWTDTQIELGTQEQSCIALFENDWFNDDEEFKANIALIKHSKEMLGMLKRSIEEIRHLKHEYTDTAYCEKYLSECEELIQKATTI